MLHLREQLATWQRVSVRAAAADRRAGERLTPTQAPEITTCTTHNVPTGATKPQDAPSVTLS